MMIHALDFLRLLAYCYNFPFLPIFLYIYLKTFQYGGKLKGLQNETHNYDWESLVES